MVIDILLLFIVGYGIYRGFSKGLIHSLFSMIGWLLGIILAFKLCAVLAPKMSEWFHSKGEWILPFTFICILLGVILIVFLIGKAVEKIFNLTQLGIVNKIAGAVLSSAVMFFVFCEITGVLNEFHALPESAKQQSKLYPMVEKLQPVMMDGVTTVLPFAKTFITELKDKVNEFADAKNVAPLVNQIH